MTAHLIILFIALPMACAIINLGLQGRVRWQRAVTLVALLTNIGLALWTLATVYAGPGEPGRILVSQMGNWPAPFGITIAVDATSALMLSVASIVCFAVALYSIGHLAPQLERHYFHPLLALLVFGVQWSFITGDLFNLFVAFEIMLMTSYALFVLGTTPKQMKQAYKYVLLNMLASTAFVTCCGWLYGQLGTLNMADIARLGLTGQIPPSALPAIALLLITFGGKTAIFPLWFWLPDTYHVLPPALVALFAGLLTKVGAYVMVRVFVMVFGSAIGPDLATLEFPVNAALAPIILVVAGITMFIGVLGAVSMNSIRRILSIHIISQVGYMILGLGLAVFVVDDQPLRVLAIAGTLFFIVHNMAVKCVLFLCGGLMAEHGGSDDLGRIGGIASRAPWLATLFFIAALSLAGLPPLSGFFGKLILLEAAYQAAATRPILYWLAGAAMLTSAFTLLSMLKIWGYGFWGPRPEAQPSTQPPRQRLGLAAVTVLVALALAMGLGAQQFLNVSTAAARTLVDPVPYIHAVLGPNALTPPTPDAPGASPLLRQRPATQETVGARPATATAGVRS